MTPVIPRWEFRVFAQEFGRAEHRIRSHESTSLRETREVYVVSLRSRANVKVRDDFLDLKTLQEVDRHHLEQWLPVIKTGFPASAEDCGQVLEALGCAIELQRDSYTWEQLASEVVESVPDLHLVDVNKKREGFLVHDCLAEIVDLEFAGDPIRTIAVEQEDSERAWETVLELGLGEWENVNYVEAMKRMLNLGARS
jgi:exopolyphosphatase/guanosine-5'-triphosphate,3'-diphosphate pyrophosphatase